MSLFPENLKGRSYHLIGIKGTGMTALAQYLHRSGASVTGSDTHETFYTDSILRKEGIPFIEGFSPENIPTEINAVIYSAAYAPESNTELETAMKSGCMVLTYPEALGELSRDRYSIGIAGVHGKTTTTAMVGTIIQELGLKGSVIVGSGVRNFDGSQVLYEGNDFLIAETCEYRRHFLHFHPNILLVTSIEPDHLDYFKSYDDIFSAFTEYVEKLPNNGILLYCGEDSGASALAKWTQINRPDVIVHSYAGPPASSWSVANEVVGKERIEFTIQKWPDQTFSLGIPGHHSVLNAVGAVAAVTELIDARYRTHTIETASLSRRALSKFAGTNRRSEIVFRDDRFIVMDDYAHHPTAIRLTLEGIRKLYPNRRIIVSSMSHTYSRTTALFKDFVSALLLSDILFLHKIYASARERKSHDSIEGIDVFNAFTGEGGVGYYVDDPLAAEKQIFDLLKPGDIFITLGAGNNWILSHNIARRLES